MNTHGALDHLLRKDAAMAIPRLGRNGTALLLVLACSARATPPTQATSDEPKSDRMYRTGSHIPVRDPQSTYSKTLDAQDVQDSMMQTPGTRRRRRATDRRRFARRRQPVRQR